MNRRHSRFMGAAAILLLWLGASAHPASAAKTREFRVERPESVLAGELKGTSVTSEGMIAPAPSSLQIFSGEASYVWGLVSDGAGGAFAATGSQGKVYHLREDGSWEVAAETLEYELFALIEGPEGLLFGGAPNGTVMRLDENGSLETRVDLPEGLVWSLIAGPDGDVFASSGEAGQIYRIAAEGTTQAFAKIPDSHVVSLAWWNEKLICGTDGRGMLVELDPSTAEMRVLYDAAEEEIVALLPRGDRLLFAANGTGASGGSGGGEGGLLVLPVIEVGPEGASTGASLYEVRADGLVRPVWQTSQKRILSLALAPDGRVLAGTGDEGVLFALDSLWNEVRLLDLPEADLLSLLAADEQLFIGTGNGGAVYRVRWEERRKGEYVSRVFDAEQVSAWGTPGWIASGSGEVVFESRSGQTASVDETWSPWVALNRGRIASPAARFLQWRMVLDAGLENDGGAVRRIVVPYRGSNRAPEITSLEVTSKAPVEVAAEAPGSGPIRQELPGGVRIAYELSAETASPREGDVQPGLWTRTLRSAVWKAHDPDDDRLRYDIFIRSTREDEFYPLELDLDIPAWSWEAAAWPDGWYQVKVIARDGEDNAEGEGLLATRLSQTFQIDNTPPILEGLVLLAEDGGWRVSGRASDAAGRIVAIEYSVDGAGWKPALSSDGIVDGSVEEFSIPNGPRDGGRAPAVVGIRVTDEAGHVAVDRVRVSAR
ncbi:MAG: hypothetical protein V1774_09830 [Candidatus Eisenbacteria bacterium]